MIYNENVAYENGLLKTNNDYHCVLCFALSAKISRKKSNKTLRNVFLLLL